MPKKILIIDDDPDILFALQLLLEDAGYRVEITEKGGRVKKLDRTTFPDLLILDMLLSGDDGREICKELKSQESTKHIPILMMSAHPAAKKESLDAGANDFIPKPFKVDELLAKVEKYF